jgi:hypothetical protein
VRRLLKDHFIPHEGNAYQPHFLRVRIVSALLLFVLVLEGVYLLGTTFVLPKSSNFALVIASALVEQTNEARLNESLQKLIVNPKLELAAKLKAEDMAQKGYFSHNSPDGKTPWDFIRASGYVYAAAGENLAVNFTDSRDVTDAWLRSPTHKANIMNGNYTEIGIATALGTYKGKSAIFVVQEFGRPSVVARDIPTATSSLVALVERVTTPNTSTPLVQGEAIVVTPPPNPRPQVAPPTSRPTPSSSALTLGEEVTRLPGADEMVLVDTTPTTTPQVASSTDVIVTPTTPILPPVATPAIPSSIIESAISTPRVITAMVFAFLVVLLLIALGLSVFIQIRIQHPHMIANALLLIALIVMIMVLNIALGEVRGVI